MGLGWEEEAEDAYEVLRDSGDLGGLGVCLGQCGSAYGVFPRPTAQAGHHCVWPHPDLSFSGYSKRLVFYLRNPLLEP